ncbi:thiol:disulfide interchange protein TlpA [Arvimicrobium flavum]|uniref:thiol:disulfide interchange protein TlpA n=1 Tax=Arvimicrobium flavum TaxID=3393320 RepID=UPI00237B0C2B|nr:TlpA disulfide reductase family protein [Mesorhizobium shangrilense]
MADPKKLLPAPKLIVAAAVAGILAGAVAVYVTEPRSGNPTASAGEAVVDAGDNKCAARADLAKAVAASAKGDVAAMLPADPPQSLKTLAFNGPDDAPMTLADRTGKTLLINLWATWCAPCREEMPALDALQKDMGGDEFEVVAINVDTGDDTKPKKFLEEIKVQSLASYRDNTMDIFNELKTRGLALGLPVTLLIDEDGCLLANMNGPAHWSGPDAKAFLTAAMGETSEAPTN